MAWQVRTPFARLVAGGVLALGLLVGPLAATGRASVDLGVGIKHATLGVDAAGDAQVTWVARGHKQTVVVTARGKLTHGGSLSGPDVSKRAHVAGLRSVVSVRSTPKGDLWALQLTAPGAGKPASLDLSHWSGTPTALTLTVHGSRLQGTVSFGGKPVTGFRTTPSGLRQKIYVYLDCSHCGGHAAWTRMLGIAPRHDGSFSVYIRPVWKAAKYRGTVAGPNVGGAFAPDAQIVIKG